MKKIIKSIIRFLLKNFSNIFSSNQNNLRTLTFEQSFIFRRLSDELKKEGIYTSKNSRILLVQFRTDSINKYGQVALPDNLIFGLLYPKKAYILEKASIVSNEQDILKLQSLEYKFLMERLICTRIHSILRDL